MLTTNQEKNKLAPKWEDGIYLGRKDSSNEYFVGTDTGVYKASEIKRVPGSERFQQARLQSMIGTPWSMTPDVESDLTTALPAVVVIPGTIEDVPDPEPSEAVPRQIFIRKEELEKHGYTKGCVRCDALRAGRSTTARHSAACRKRIEEAMQADESEENQARLKATVTRRNEYIEKRVAEDVAAQQAKKPRIDSVNPPGSVRRSDQSLSAPPRLTTGADDTKKRRLESQADPPVIQQPSRRSSLSQPVPAQPKRKLEETADDPDALHLQLSKRVSRGRCGGALQHFKENGHVLYCPK